MKILLNKEYDSLTNEIALLKEQNANLLLSKEAAIMKLIEIRERFSMSFSIRRFIVGPYASGKTALLKNVIIPNLGNNYFLVDVNNEYDFVPLENKYVLDKKLSGKELRDDLLVMFKLHSSKVIIMEDAMVFDRDFSWFFHGTDRNRQFIIVSYTLSSISQHIGAADLVYDFGATDYFQRNTDLLNSSEMNKFVRMSLDDVLKGETKKTFA